MKTIEEAAYEYAKDVDYPAPENGWYESDYMQMEDCLEETFKAGANHIMSLPLSERITAEEREKIKQAYKAMSDYGKGQSSDCCACANYGARIWAERIFGAEMFAEKGGEK